MAWPHRVVFGQGEQHLFNAPGQCGRIATRQIRPAHTSSEQHIPAHDIARGMVDEHDVTRRMTRRVSDLEFEGTEAQRVAIPE